MTEATTTLTRAGPEHRLVVRVQQFRIGAGVR